MMHPTLTTAQGKKFYRAGPVRDVVNIIDVTDFGDSNFDPDGRMRMVSVAQYAGNLLSDAYVALWTVANAFYEAYVLETRGCGNFGSNLTSPYGQCAATSKTPTLTGRDVAMVQKRFFGGLKLTQAFVDFATVPGYSLGDLLAKNPEVIARRQSRHYLLCNGDAMFHPGKGVVGVKLDFVGGVSLKNVTIAKVENAGDDGHWLCDRQRTYRLPKTGELVAVQRIDGGTYKGGDARGLRLGKSAGVVMDDVYIDDIVALEGAAYGVDMGADTNDQSDWESSSIDFGDVEIGSAIRAGAGARAFPLATGANPGALRFFSKGKGGGLAIADGPERHHQFDRPRILLSYGFWEKQSMNATDLFGKMNDEGRPVDYYRNLTERIFGGDLGRIYAQRQKAVNWLYEQHGVVVDVPENTDWLETVTMPNGDEFYAGNVFPDLHKYPGVAVCAGAECTGNELQTVAWHDLIWTYEVKSENLTYYGAFGGVEGWKAQIGDAILIGTYSVEGLPFDNGNNIFIDYYATCPLRFNQYYNQSSLAEGVVEVTRTQVMLNCEVESGVLGKGITIGVVSNFWDPDTSKVENPT